MDWKTSADALKSCVDVALRLLIAVAIILVLVAPGFFPFLTRFTVKSGEVNIFGSKFEIAEIGSIVPGVEIKNNRIYLQGTDISTYPDTVGRLTTENNKLKQAEKELTDHLKEVATLLDQVTKAAPNPNEPPKSAEYVQKLQQQQQQLQTQVAESEASAKELAAATLAPASPTTLLYGIVFGADNTKEQAMYEATKAQALLQPYDAPVSLYRREKLIRGVAGFTTRDAAAAALPTLSAKFRGSYIVDLRTWCPAATTVVALAGNAPAEIDCHF